MFENIRYQSTNHQHSQDLQHAVLSIPIEHFVVDLRYITISVELVRAAKRLVNFFYLVSVFYLVDL